MRNRNSRREGTEEGNGKREKRGKGRVWQGERMYTIVKKKGMVEGRIEEVV